MAIDYEKKTWGTYAWNDELTVAQNVAAARNANALIESSDLQRIEDAVSELAGQNVNIVQSVNDKTGEVVLTASDISATSTFVPPDYPDVVNVQVVIDALEPILKIIGEGLASGTAGQVLTKSSSDMFDYGWEAPPPSVENAVIGEGVSKIVTLYQYQYEELTPPIDNSVLYVILESPEPAL